MPLIDTRIRQAKPQEKSCKLYHANGLYPIVNPNSSKWWRLKYRLDGKARTISIGVYPGVSLKQAKEAARAALKQLARWLDPSALRKAEKQAAAIHGAWKGLPSGLSLRDGLAGKSQAGAPAVQKR